MLKRFTQNFTGQIVFVLVLFLISRLLCSSVFYEGFLHNFSRFNSFLFGSNKVPAVLAQVPFYSFSILLSALLHPFFLVALLLLFIPLFLKRKLLSDKKNYFPLGARVIVFSAAFILAWELCTYNYNYYLNI